MFTKIADSTFARHEPHLNSFLLVHKGRVRVVARDTTLHKELQQRIPPVAWDRDCYSVPRNVQIQVTKACNFRCSFCYANAVNSRDPKMYFDLDKLKNLIDRFFAWGVPNFQYVGGETFMHPGFPELVEHVQSLGASQSLITNGIIPGLQMEKYGETIGHFSRIQVSSNGVGSNFEEAVDVDGIWQRFRIALKNIASRCDNTWISFVVTEKNFEDIPAILEVAKSSGARGVRFGAVAKQGRGRLAEDAYFQILPKAEKLLEKFLPAADGLRIECHFNSAFNRVATTTAGSEGRNMIFVNLEGFMFPFPLLDIPEFNLGNAFDCDIQDVWRNHGTLQRLRSAESEPQDCRDCTARCGLGGASMRYLWTGRLGGKLPCSRFSYAR